jgi:hypothetical protein
MHTGLNCADEGDSYFIPARYVERVTFCDRPFRPGMCVDRLA